MYYGQQKRSFDTGYWLILLLLFASVIYLLNFSMWKDIIESDFPLGSHIIARLGHAWTVFWPAILSAAVYPFIKNMIWGSKWQKNILFPWKLFTLVLIAVLWWAYFYGS